MAEMDPETLTTPWRRDPAETTPALARWVEHTHGGRCPRRGRRRARQRDVERDGVVHGRAPRRHAGTARRAPRADARRVSRLSELRPRPPTPLHGPGARAHHGTGAGVSLPRDRHRVARHAVPRHGADRRRGARRRAAVRVRRVGHGCHPRTARRAGGQLGRGPRAGPHHHPDERRPHVHHRDRSPLAPRWTRNSPASGAITNGRAKR